MTIDYHQRIMDYFRKNQDSILNAENNKNSLALIYRPLECKESPKSNKAYFDILIIFNEQLYVVKHIKISNAAQILPLNFEDSFVLRYKETREKFRINGHVLNEGSIENDFDYELSNPEENTKIAYGIMTSFPFLDECVSKFKSNVSSINRNEPCPCGSNKKFKKCCMY